MIKVTKKAPAAAKTAESSKAKTESAALAAVAPVVALAPLQAAHQLPRRPPVVDYAAEYAIKFGSNVKAAKKP